jgi:hypothetical protein
MDYSKLTNDPAYMAACKEWEYRRAELQKAKNAEYKAWKVIEDMEEKFKNTNNILGK